MKCPFAAGGVAGAKSGCGAPGKYSKVCVVITVGERWKWQHIGGAGEEGEPGSLRTPSNWTGHYKWRESVINLIRQAWTYPSNAQAPGQPKIVQRQQSPLSHTCPGLNRRGLSLSPITRAGRGRRWLETARCRTTNSILIIAPDRDSSGYLSLVYISSSRHAPIPRQVPTKSPGLMRIVRPALSLGGGSIPHDSL